MGKNLVHSILDKTAKLLTILHFLDMLVQNAYAP